MQLPAKREKLAVEIPAELAGMFSLTQNMEGVVPRLPQIKIIHMGQLYELPDDSKPETFEGIILDQHPANAWWKEKMQPGVIQPPNCFSMDAITPEELDTRQSESCLKCPLNEFGSDPEGGKGKACKNMKRLHILMQDSLLPRRLTIPPTSITSFEKYMTQLVDRGLPYAVVVTNFSLKKMEAGTLEWSEVNFTKDRILEPEELALVASAIKQYKDAARMQDIQADEYMPEEEKKDDIPF